MPLVGDKAPSERDPAAIETIGTAALTERAASEDLVAVFVADWCPFCRAFLRETAASKPGESPVVYVDISDESDPAWEEYRIGVVPTAIRFQHGRETGREPGRLMVGIPADRFARFRQPPAPGATTSA
ncbi:MAG: thioredoxin family protein [Thermoplasmatota archaeon]